MQHSPTGINCHFSAQKVYALDIIFDSSLILGYVLRNHQLELESKKCGQEVSSSISGIINHFSKSRTDDEFLNEWWSVQRKLHDTESAKGRRYPPSVIRSDLTNAL